MKSPEAASLRYEIGQNLLMVSADNVAALIQRADFLIEAEVQSMAAEERRRTVLARPPGQFRSVTEVVDEAAKEASTAGLAGFSSDPAAALFVARGRL
jgi:hypothetical protein